MAMGRGDSVQIVGILFSCNHIGKQWIMEQDSMAFSKVFEGSVHFLMDSPVAASEEQLVNVRVNF
jgi:hypothetical protein